MSQIQVPQIFSSDRRRARSLRAASRQERDPSAARFISDEIAADMTERLQFVRAEPDRALLVGQVSGELLSHLAPATVTALPFLDLERPYDLDSPGRGFDFIGISGELDAVNDLPGALIHARNALAPGGLVIASFVGGGSLRHLRRAMMAAEKGRTAARMHPLVDARAAPDLLQRAGWKDPVVDTFTLKVRYGALDRLVSDLRDQALGNALADHAPPLGKEALARASSAFLDQADDDGKVTETFEIITLTGRRSLAGT
ncbi:methyltransferase domain-containing protein [Erythrobacteraceae bacterium WH01K]|nr:methyltransferase domain-containing protein [Erythrobacteraceae bacterium WH01K]